MLSKDWMKGWTGRPAWLLACAALLMASNAFAATPPVTVSKLTTISPSGLGTPAQIVQDTCGNLYELDGNKNLYEIPAGSSGAATQLPLSGTPEGGGLAIGPNNTLYLSSYQWDGKMLQVPSTNCVPQTSAATEFASPNGDEGWWYFPQAVATDATGNLFIAISGNEILEFSAATSTLSVLLKTSSTPNFIAVDAGDNVYFTYNNSGTVYEIPYSSTGYAATATSISTSLTDAAGMAFDAAGNMYVVDSNNNTVYEIPYSVNAKALVPANAYPVAANANGFISIANDGKTLLFAQPQYSGTTLSELVPGSANIGQVAIGSSATALVNILFNTAASPATISVNSATGVFTNASAGTCSANSYSAGSSCTVSVQFSPATPGVATGGVVLTDASGKVVATADISGTGTAAAVSVDPGVVSSFGNAFKTPASIAIDYAGDVFFADSGLNAVLEIPAGSTTAVSLGSGFNAPTGVAVDGAGNVYVADTGNSEIVEIPVVNGALSTSAQITLISSSTSVAGKTLSNPAGVTVDSAGNLFIADSGNKRVVYLPYVGSWDFSLALTLGSGMISPSAIAVDASGDAFVADAGNGDVYELPVPFTKGVQVTVASGYSAPSALALDASGSLFVVDRGNSKVWRIPNPSGTLSPASAVNVIGQVNSSGTATIADPYGIAVGPTGNLYVSDNINAAAYLVNRTNSTQSFGIWNPGTTSGTLTFDVENSGDASLALNTPFETATGDTTMFSILSGETGACANGATVAAGASCNLEAQFAPTVNGAYTDTLTLSSNAYASGQQLVFTGTGATTTPTTTKLAITSPSGSPAYDQAVSLSATVSASTGTPGGSVNLVVDGIVKQTATLNSSGVATFTLAGGVLSGGSHSILANYLGQTVGFAIFSQSTSSAVAVNVTTVSTATALSFTTLYTNPTSQPAGIAINFTATVSSSFAGVPSGIVTFVVSDSSGKLATGTGILQPASGGTFQATYTYANTTTPANGAAFDLQSVVATYGGDTNFTASSSSSASFDVAPANGSVKVTASGTSVTSSATSSTSVTFTSTSYGGWNGLVGFSCLSSSLPVNARCVFSPGQIQVMPSTPAASVSNTPVTLTVAIDQPPQTPTASKLIWWLAFPAGLLLWFARRRFMRQGWTAIPMALALIFAGIAASGLVACNSGNLFPTPAGNTTITVYAWADPFTTLPSSSNTTPNPQTCGINPTTKSPDPTLAPCSQTAFQVSVTAQ
jgi:sugar lactone lactonase YvrE